MNKRNFPSTKAHKAAEKWCSALGVAESPNSFSPERTIRDLADAAFGLYEIEWKGSVSLGIDGWAWPFTELTEGGTFAGSQPWTVLLREAVGLARKVPA